MPLMSTTTTTGKDLLAAIAAGRIAPPPAAELLRLDLEYVGDGETHFGFAARPEYGNPDAVHGGILAAIADFAAATAIWTRLPAEARVVTADLHVSFLRRVDLDGGRWRCVGRATHLGHTQANATAEIVAADGTIHVQAMATCRILTPGRSGSDGR